MTRMLLLAGAFVVLAAAPAGAVSGGTALPIEQAPYIAWLDGRCTGTLVSPTRILTAGHCLDGADATGAHVLVGVDGNATAGRGRFVAVRGYAVHPGFHEAFPFAHRLPQNAIAVDDVGLIVLARPVRGIAPVALGAASPGAAAALQGFGFVGPPGRPPLQQGAVTVIPAGACGRAYPHAIRPAMLCTQDLAHATPPLVQPCAGDSGGPVIVSSASGPVQVGITSWGPEVMDGRCGKTPLPAVAMRVSAYARFITAAHPALAPRTRGGGSPHIAGRPRVGRTVSCVLPALRGGHSRITYRWTRERGLDIVPIRGAHARRLPITRALYRSTRAPRRIFCEATVRNAGGRLSLGSGSADLTR